MFIVKAYTLRCIYVHSNRIHIEGAFMFIKSAYTLRCIYVHSYSIHIEVNLCS